MTLTKEDLAAIENLFARKFDENFDRKFDEKLGRIKEIVHEESAPMREAMKELLKTQIRIVNKLDDVEKHVYQIMHHLRISPTTADLENALRDLD